MVCWTRLGTALAYIALAFFIVRISLAAASAPGEAGFSGVAAGAAGAFFCCASAGTAVRASPIARPAADKIRERLFIPFSSITGVTAAQLREFPARLPGWRCWPGQ